MRRSRRTRAKVLLISPAPPPEGGIATWTKHILSSTAFEEVDIFHLNSALKSHDNIGGSIPARIFLSLEIIARLVFILIIRRPSIVHMASSGPPGYFRTMIYIYLTRLFGGKPVLNLRFGDVDAFEFPWIIKVLISHSIRLCWYVIPITNPMYQLIKCLGGRRIRVIPNCVDVRSTVIGGRNPNCGGELRVLFVGWLVPPKGIDDLLQAISKTTKISLTLIGPKLKASNLREAYHRSYGIGMEEDWIENRVKELEIFERVNLLGPMDPDKTREAYLESDVLVLPSYREGFPNVVIEAMEAGMPIVATRVGAIPEIVCDEVDGLLIEPGDCEALARNLAWLRDHPKEMTDMGLAGRRKMLERYTVEKVAEQWLQLYGEAEITVK